MLITFAYFLARDYRLRRILDIIRVRSSQAYKLDFHSYQNKKINFHMINELRQVFTDHADKKNKGKIVNLGGLLFICKVLMICLKCEFNKKK